jgi:hypothetical protein
LVEKPEVEHGVIKYRLYWGDIFISPRILGIPANGYTC